MTWETQADPIAATRAVLKMNAALGELVGGRIWGVEVPRQEAKHMPREAVVIRQAGRPGGTPGGGDTIKHQRMRLDIRCYGSTPHRARRVQIAVDIALKAFRRKLIEGCLVQSYVWSGGPFSMRDQDAKWPMVITTWQVLCADSLV